MRQASYQSNYAASVQAYAASLAAQLAPGAAGSSSVHATAGGGAAGPAASPPRGAASAAGQSRGRGPARHEVPPTQRRRVAWPASEVRDRVGVGLSYPRAGESRTRQDPGRTLATLSSSAPHNALCAECRCAQCRPNRPHSNHPIRTEASPWRAYGGRASWRHGLARRLPQPALTTTHVAPPPR